MTTYKSVNKSEVNVARKTVWWRVFVFGAWIVFFVFGLLLTFVFGECLVFVFGA